MSSSRRPANEVTRKVFFYRIDAGQEDTGEESPHDIRPTLKTVNDLSFAEGQRYVDNGDGNSTCAWVDRIASPSRMRLATIRKTDLPQFEARGQMKDLNLPEDAGLAEAMHLVFFPDNIIGAEFNFYGPRATRLLWYLRETAPRETTAIQAISPLMRSDVYRQLTKLKSIRALTLKAKPSFAAVLANEDKNLASILEAAAAIDGTGQILVRIGLEPYARTGSLGSGVFAAIKRLVKGRALSEDGEVTKFEVEVLNPETARVETVDLLHDHLVAETRIVKVDTTTRVLLKESAFSAIDAAHETMKNEISAAIAVSR